MLPSWAKIVEYLSFTAASEDEPAVLSGAFKAMIEPFAIETFACGKLHLAHRHLAAFYAIEWPDDWRQYYVKSGLIHRDPVLEALSRTRAAFTWSELRLDGRFSKAGTEALRAAADHGWTEGLIVPVERSDPFVGLVSLVARRSPFGAEEKGFLTLLSIHFYQRMRDVARTTGCTLPPAGLTNREIACLRLVAMGCSDRRVGERLGISTATAHEHFENAKKKLNATTRAEVIATAVSLAIIHPI